MRRVIFVISFCIPSAAPLNKNGTISPINIIATTESTEIAKNALVSIVFAISCASSLFFVRYCEKTGKNAAESAPAMNKLNIKSGIRNEALYASVMLVVPKWTAIMRSRANPNR